MLSAYIHYISPFIALSQSIDGMWRGNPKLRTIFVSFPPSPPPSYEYKSTNIRVEIRDGGLITFLSRGKHTHTRICRVKYTKHCLHMWNKTWAHIRSRKRTDGSREKKNRSVDISPLPPSLQHSTCKYARGGKRTTGGGVIDVWLLKNSRSAGPGPCRFHPECIHKTSVLLVRPSGQI